MKMLFKALPKPGDKKKPAAKAAPSAKPTSKPDPKQVDLASPNFVGLLALLKQCAAGGEFGKHNVGEGDTVAFNAGAFAGSGEVIAAGEHGPTVKDDTGREHRVHWHEVTGHQPGKKKEGKK
jgi:hypothetical protein